MGVDVLVWWMLRWFGGYVHFVGKGGDAGKFLQLCREQGIQVFFIRCSNCVLQGAVAVNKYRHLRIPARKSGIRIRCTDRIGGPFLWQRFLHRPGILVGVSAMILMMSLLSMFIWDVQVQAPAEMQDTLLQQLGDLGIHPGMLKTSLTPRRAEQLILLQNPDLSWAGLTTMGSRVVLKVRSRVEAPPLSGTQGNVHITAKTDGVIASFSATSGKALVQVGEAVRKGEVLISGIVADEKTGMTLYRKASGSVQAYTVHSVSVEGDFNEETTIETANKKTYTDITLLGITIPLYWFGPSDGDVLYEETSQPLYLFGHRTGITVGKKVFCQTKTISLSRTEEQLLDDLRLEAYETVQQQITDGVILSREEEIRSSETGIRLLVKFNCLEEIGTEETFAISPS